MRTIPVRPPPVRDEVADPFQQLPHPVPSQLLHYLDARSRKHLEWAVPADAVFRTTLRVYIPPDAARRDPLIQQLDVSSAASTETRPSRFTVVDHGLLSSLSPIADQVEDIKFTHSKYLWLPRFNIHAATWPLLQAFHRLVRLKIRAVPEVDEVDLDLLSRCLPQLQKLSIQDCYHVVNKLQRLPELRTLKFIDTNIDSFAIADNWMPKLRSLTLLKGDSDESVFDINKRGGVLPPLQVLQVCGCWSCDTSGVIHRHRPTLEKCHLMDVDREPRYELVALLRAGASFPVLRSLNLGCWEHIDLEPLAVLVILEALTLMMHPAATHCRPLQRLKKLRTLDITRGWLRDIVGCIPSLNHLACHDSAPRGSDPHPRAIFDTPNCDEFECNIRTLIVRGDFGVGSSDHVVALLQRVEQVEVATWSHPLQILSLISRLPRLRRVFILTGSTIHGVHLVSFASISCLEEIFAVGWDLQRDDTWLAGASRLRKLALNWKTTPIDVCPPSLTHLYLPYTGLVVCESRLPSSVSACSGDPGGGRLPRAAPRAPCKRSVAAAAVHPPPAG